MQAPSSISKKSSRALPHTTDMDIWDPASRATPLLKVHKKAASHYERRVLFFEEQPRQRWKALVSAQKNKAPNLPWRGSMLSSFGTRMGAPHSEPLPFFSRWVV